MVPLENLDFEIDYDINARDDCSAQSEAVAR